MSTVNSLPAANSHYISLEDAIDMTTAYRAERETMLSTAYKNQNTLPLSETFNRAAVDALLAVEGCEGLRIYYGTIESKLHAIMVPVGENNQDLLPSLNQQLVPAETDVIVELAQRCPDECPPASPLNT